MATIDRLGATVTATGAPSSATPNPNLAIKTAARAATTGSNIVLSGLQTIDGVALNAGDRVLVKDQTNQTLNGIYNAAAGNWAFASDFQDNTQVAQGLLVVATNGTANGGQVFELTTPNPITLGTSNLTFSGILNYSRTGGTISTKSTAYAVASGDNGNTHELNSATPFTVTVGAASGLGNPFSLKLINAGSAAILLSVTGFSNFYLYPQQTLRLTGDGTNLWLDPYPQRWYPAGGTTFYVDVNGSDSNDGLAAGASRAFATIAQAYATAFSVLDLGPSDTCFVNLAANETHNVGAGINLNYGAKLKDLQFIGGSGTVVSCNAGGVCFATRDGAATVSLSTMTLATAGNGSTLLSVTHQSICDQTSVNYNAAPSGVHCHGAGSATTSFAASYSINGNASIHIQLLDTFVLDSYANITVTGASNLTFTDFLTMTNNSVLDSNGVAATFAGFSGITAQKYVVQNNSVASTNGATLPGGTAGSTLTGGIYT